MKDPQNNRMWRTLVRVIGKRFRCSGTLLIEDVILSIPGRSAHGRYSCPRQAIPPVIWNTMDVGRRYHVECNFGCVNNKDLCFDKWEDS